MATTIKIKHRDVDTAPTSLRKGELAYAIATGPTTATPTNGADKLVIGTGAEDINGQTNQLAVVGGKYFTDMLNHNRGILTPASAVLVNDTSQVDEFLAGNFSLRDNVFKVLNGVDFATKGQTTATDLDLNITTLRNGVIRYVPTTGGEVPTTTYSARLRTLDDDNAIPNKLYVDEEIAGVASGSTTLNINAFNDAADIAGNSYAGQAQVHLSLAEIFNVVAGTGLSLSLTDADFGQTTPTATPVTLTFDADIATAGANLAATTLGIASFSSVNFTVASGFVTSNDITLGTTALTLGETTADIVGLTNLQSGNIKLAGDTISNEVSTGDGNITLVPKTNGVVVIGTLNISKTGTIAANTDSSINITPGATGVVSVANSASQASKITNVADPTNPTDAANKKYVDEVAQGLTIRPAARAATTGNLDATYGVGTLGVGATLTANANEQFPLIDGVGDTTPSLGGLVTQTDRAWLVNDLVLVRSQTTKAENGLYKITNLGSAGTPWVLTRHEYVDEKDEIPSSYVFVQEGDTLAGTGWAALVGDFNSFDVGQDEIFWYQFSGAGSVSAGNGITVAGTQVSVRLHPTINSGLEFDGSGNLVIDTVPVLNGGTGRNTVAKNALVFGNDAVTGDGLGIMGATKSPGDTTAGTGDWNSSNQIPTFDGTLVRWTTTIDGGTWT